MIVLVVVAAAIVGAPIVAAVIVSYASLREESAYSLCSRPPGVLAAFARRLLSFQSHGVASVLHPHVPRPRRAADASTSATSKVAPRAAISGATGAAPRAGTAGAPGVAPTADTDSDAQCGQSFAVH
jgi:hypothetical protein